MANSLQNLTDYKLSTSFPVSEENVIESNKTILAGLPAYMVVKKIESPGVIILVWVQIKR
jgi:hypothetical protein